MNAKLPLIVSVATVVLLRSTGLAADNRFDGTWVGTETVMGQEFHGFQRSEKYAHNTPAKIVIAQGGALLGVIEGYGPGRYNDVKRAGNTIVFHAGNRTGQLSLSPDGQTLVEKGRVPDFFILGYAGRQGALSGHQRVIQSDEILPSRKSTSEVTGTFHRQK
jgi:hypothetical protein